MKKAIIVFCVGIFLITSCKQPVEEQKSYTEVVEKNEIDRVEPPHWWTGLKNDTLQLLVQHPNVSGATPSINSTAVTLDKVHLADSENYIFLDIIISEESEAVKFNIDFTFKDGSVKSQTYQLKDREKEAGAFEGFDSSDVVYLITPDRYANGDPSNDSFPNLKQVEVDRNLDYMRHGGDIRGIINSLDYIDDMGYTAIWSSPLLINDMPQWSYHGYAITDYYKVDPRFGTLQDYKELANKASQKGIKLIMDQVANHSGLGHWWMQDLPYKDWINHQQAYEENKENWDWKKATFSNHRRTTNQDQYASQADREGNNEGWFVDAMPDLNQRNPFMANYIIQNSIWWIEELGLGGIRQDTYPYPDKDFMANWAGAIMNEYPNFNIVGEEWSYNPLLIGYWQEGNKNKDGYDSNLRSVMDFAMQAKITEGINEEESWDKGLVKIYEGLANDFAYVEPLDVMIFNDNHDMDRIHTQMKEDVENTKMAVSTMLMLPRTPQMYYGTEILMENSAKPGDHGLIRTDFPGGWKDDSVSAFTGEGLTSQQKEMQQFVKKLLNYRKNSTALHTGKTLHFAPQDGVYVLMRMNDDETVVHILNKNKESKSLGLERFKEVGLDGKTLKNIVTNQTVAWKDTIALNQRGSIILSTKQ